MTGVQIIVSIALLATLGILLAGVVGMAKGGEFNQKYGNKLMRLLVLFQFTAILLMLVLGYLFGK